MMRAASRLAFLALAVPALCSCGEKEEAQDADLKAGGRILERSITDEMLPYDTLRSQPPLAAPELKAGDGANVLAGGTDAPQGEAGTQASEAAMDNAAAANQPVPPVE